MKTLLYPALVRRDLSLPAVAGARRRGPAGPFVSLLILFAAALSTSAQPVKIGSKKFTESYVLGEIAKRALNEAGISAEHRQGMGGTIILWEALRTAQIDAYPEYTGTIAQEILKTDRRLSIQEIREALAKKAAEEAAAKVTRE